eukprot:TRINITY_DN14823_c0_g1_i1.p1 TRINITY_DN14823_c0_g1~~TRINITY_DN14823_c0_g1_i1.p1  ORF type:complete len:668 (+),score=46.15 TRINITY_DN14823_c0_g1_i1:92-2095(+)
MKKPGQLGQSFVCVDSAVLNGLAIHLRRFSDLLEALCVSDVAHTEERLAPAHAVQGNSDQNTGISDVFVKASPETVLRLPKANGTAGSKIAAALTGKTGGSPRICGASPRFDEPIRFHKNEGTAEHDGQKATDAGTFSNTRHLEFAEMLASPGTWPDFSTREVVMDDSPRLDFKKISPIPLKIAPNPPEVFYHRDSAFTQDGDDLSITLCTDSASANTTETLPFEQDSLACSHPCQSAKSMNRAVVDVIGGWCVAAKLLLFFGGLSRFKRQKTYDAVFIGAYLICFLSCVIAMCFSPVTPFHNGIIGILTVYVHIIGLHSWAFWKMNMSDQRFGRFVLWMIDENTSRWQATVIRNIKFKTRVFAWLCLALQLVLTSSCIVGASGPSFDMWLSGEHTRNARMLALIHAIAMVIAIPLHVPSIILALLAFIFVNHLHHVDIGKVTQRVDARLNRLKLKRPPPFVRRHSSYNEHTRLSQENCGPEVIDEEEREADRTAKLVVGLVCEEAEKAQLRLEWSCTRWRLLWVHQLVFAFFAVLVTVHSVGPFLLMSTREESLQAWQQTSNFAIAMLFFHGLMGICILLAVLITPAATTSYFKRTCDEFLHFMRETGSGIDMCDSGAGFLEKRVLGFRIWLLQVNPALVSSFYSVVALCIMFLTSVSDGTWAVSS